MRINKYYLFSFIYHIAYSALVAVAIVAFKEQGLSITQITLAESIAWASSLILEVPSGMLADYFGRKRTVIIACLFELASLIVYFFTRNFLSLLIGQLLFAVSECSLSGTFDAWLFSKANKDTSEARIKISRNGNACLIGNIFGGVIGGLISIKWKGWLWIFSSALIIVCLIICLTMEDIVEKKEIKSFSEGIRLMFSPLKSFTSLFKVKPAIIMLPEMWFIAFFLSTPNSIWQLYLLKLLKKDTGFISVMWIIIQLIQIAVNKLIEKNKSVVKHYIIVSLISLFAISVLVYLLGTLNQSIIIIILFCLFLFFYSLQGPILSTYTAEIFEEKDRATCFSVLSLIGSVISALGLSLGGVISEKYGYEKVYELAGISIGCIFVLHLLFSVIITKKSKNAI